MHDTIWVRIRLVHVRVGRSAGRGSAARSGAVVVPDYLSVVGLTPALHLHARVDNGHMTNSSPVLCIVVCMCCSMYSSTFPEVNPEDRRDELLVATVQLLSFELALSDRACDSRLAGASCCSSGTVLVPLSQSVSQSDSTKHSTTAHWDRSDRSS